MLTIERDYIFEKSRLDSESLKSCLEEMGYAVVRNVIDPAEVARIKTKCESYLKQDHAEETEVEASEFIATEEFTSIPFDADVIRILKAALDGQVAIYPNFVVRINRYTNWHIDNGFHPDFHDDPDHLLGDRFSHLQCMVYLQDNDEIEGGGLDVVHGSHKWHEKGVAPQLSEMKVNPDDVVSLKSRAGDMIMFDGRLIHGGTPAKDRANVAPKYGVFWSVSGKDARQSKRFTDYLKGRADYLVSLGLTGDYLKYMVDRYNDVLKVQYPSSFNDTLQRIVETEDLEMISIR